MAKKINDGKTPQERWAQKNEYIAKSFRMYRHTADDFAEACKAAGVSQAAKITELMQQFIDEVNKTEKMIHK